MPGYRFAATALSLRLAFCAAMMVLGLISTPLRGEQGTFSGRLTDWQARPLAHCRITLRSTSTGVALHAVTDERGEYRVTGIPVGEYRLEGDAGSDGRGSVGGILIAGGHRTKMTVALRLEAAEIPDETALPAVATGVRALDLYAPGPYAPDPEEMARTTVIAQRELQAMPADGRSWTEFAKLTPGKQAGSAQVVVQVVAGAGSGAGGFSSGGFSTGEAGSGAGSGMERMQAPESAVGRVEMGARSGALNRAEAAATRLNVASRRGSEKLHGAAMILSRQNLWGAKNPFTVWTQLVPDAGGGLPQVDDVPYTPPNHKTEIDAGMGGMWKAAKLGWYAALASHHANDPAMATMREPDSFFAQPTNAQIQVLGARLGGAYASDAGATQYYATLMESLAGLLGPVARTSQQWTGFVRGDRQMTERLHVSAEGGIFSLDAPNGGISMLSENYGSHSFGMREEREQWALAQGDYFVNENLLGSVSANWSHVRMGVEASSASDFEACPAAVMEGADATGACNGLDNNAWGRMPQIAVDTYGLKIGTPSRFGGEKYPDESRVEAAGILSWVKGRHLLKVGIDVAHVGDAVDFVPNRYGSYKYTNAVAFAADLESYMSNGYDIANPDSQHNCWVNPSSSQPSLYHALGNLPCYAWYSQTIGPSLWTWSNDEIALFATDQWQWKKGLTISASVRYEKQLVPAPIASVENPAIPETEKLPDGGMRISPRVAFAYAPQGGEGLTIRGGVGIYYGEVTGPEIHAGIAQTGSLNGDLKYFVKPTDVGAPPFPYVYQGQPGTAILPGAVFFGPRFRVPEIDQAQVSVEEKVGRHLLLDAGVEFSLGRRLAQSVDQNLVASSQTITYQIADPYSEGPLRNGTSLTVPIYTLRGNANYQQMNEVLSRANSKYEAFVGRVRYSGREGLSVQAQYAFAHAWDDNPNNGGNVNANDPLDIGMMGLEHGIAGHDQRQNVSGSVVWEALTGSVWLRGWRVAMVGQYHGGLPYTMRVEGYLPTMYSLDGGAEAIKIQGVATGVNGSGGDNRIYGWDASGSFHDVGRNTYRYPATWTADTRLGKGFRLKGNRKLEILAESFNLFNHQNVTEIENNGYVLDTVSEVPTLTFLSGTAANTTAFGKPLNVNATNLLRPRQVQFGARVTF